MQSSIQSPVPKEQIPLHEFIELSSSFFFSWPRKGTLVLFKNLILSWLLTLPIFIIISTGSYSSKGDIAKIIIISFISSLIVPLAILIRQFLGWNYICSRLRSHYIFYEESDWHDGQTWEKPNFWKIRDNLIATQEVLPILSLISKITISLLLLLSISTSCLLFFTHK